MSFGNHTPEAFLPRSDSRDPATTCKGLTAAGRPCRRALAASVAKPSADLLQRNRNGVVAVLDEGEAAAFFCWQHKDQAAALIARLNPRTQVLPLKQKSSIDTLVERIGVLELEEEVGEKSRTSVAQESRRFQDRQPPHDSGRFRRRSTLPQEWQRIQGPLMSVPEDVRESEGYRVSQRPPRAQRQHPSDRRHSSNPPGRSNVKASWSCCITVDEDELPPPRRSQHRHSSRPPQRRREDRYKAPSRPMASGDAARYQPTSQTSTPIRRREDNVAHSDQYHPHTVTYPRLDPLPDSPLSTPKRRAEQVHSSASPPNSHTTTLLSLIPAHLSPSTTSSLLSELSKPISSADEEGYIYIFWLTPDTDVSKPDDETASSLLDADDFLSTSPRLGNNRNNARNDSRPRRRSSLDRRQATDALTAQALQRFASINRGPSEPKKILLKIGRASNVHRRLSQWSRQCGQNITLIRYYPYHNQRRQQTHDSRPDREAGVNGPVPHVHRVERLIHLELADQRVADKGRCEQCGREHKEWFEVEATRAGVKAVDEVVRRWVDWAFRTGT